MPLHHLDMIGGKLVDEARGNGRVPLAVNAAIAGEKQLRAAFCAGEADVGQPALLLEARLALLIKRALVREHAFLPAGQEHGLEFEALRGVQRHNRNAIVGLVRGGVHHEGDVLEEAGEVLELFHRADEFLEVFEPPGGIGRTVLLPHIGVAGLLENGFGQLVVRRGLDHAGPARESLH